VIDNNSKRSNILGASLKNQTKDKVPKKTTVLVNFNRAVFSLLDFYTVENGTGLIGHPTTLERRYHSKQCNISKEWRSRIMIW